MDDPPCGIWLSCRTAYEGLQRKSQALITAALPTALILKAALTGLQHQLLTLCLIVASS